MAHPETKWNMEKTGRRRELRKFGLTVGIAFGALGVLFLLRGKSFYPYFLGLCGAFILLGLIIPVALSPVQKIWMRVAYAMGWVVTRLILSILFFVIITGLALLGRLLFRDPLKLKFRDGADSYWIARGNVVRDRRDYERQY